MQKYVVGNWKSNKTISEAQSWVEQFSVQAEGFSEKVEVVVAPPFPLLSVLTDGLHATKVKLGVQDISQFDAGSYTGAISVRNLEELPITYAIVGHSERRRYFHETNIDVAGKVVQAVSADITPIVCIDEDYLTSQAAAIEDEYLKQCVVAYEPVAAIGTGNNVDVGTVKAVQQRIQNAFGDVPVLYGGSVTPQNVAEYTLVCDGVLVGGASLKAEEFAGVVQKAA